MEHKQQGTTYLVSENPSEIFKTSVLSQKFTAIKILSTISAAAALLVLLFVNAMHGLTIAVNLACLIFIIAPLAVECIGYWMLQKEGYESGDRMSNPLGLTLVKVVAIYHLVVTIVCTAVAVILFFISIFATEVVSSTLEKVGDYGDLWSAYGALSGDSFSVSDLSGVTMPLILTLILCFVVIFSVCFLYIFYHIKKLKMLNALKALMLGEKLRQSEKESYDLPEYVAYFTCYRSIEKLVSAASLFVLLPSAATASAVVFFLLLIYLTQAGCSGVADLLIATGMMHYNKSLAAMNADNSRQLQEMHQQMAQLQGMLGEKDAIIAGKDQEIRSLTNQIGKKLQGSKQGTITCIGGNNAGATYDISDGSEYVIGRDPHVCSIVIDSVYAKVSKKHVGIIYDAARGVYKLVDYSSNGTFRTDGKKLTSGKYNLLNSGNTITLASTDNKFRLN